MKILFNDRDDGMLKAVEAEVICIDPRDGGDSGWDVVAKTRDGNSYRIGWAAYKSDAEFILRHYFVKGERR